jgi:hypothetical protein
VGIDLEAKSMMKQGAVVRGIYGSSARHPAYRDSRIFLIASSSLYISTFLVIDFVTSANCCRFLVQVIASEGWGWPFRLCALAFLVINLGFAVAFVGQWNIYFSPAATSGQGSVAHRLGRWRPVFATLVFAGILFLHSILFMFMTIAAAFFSW